MPAAPALKLDKALPITVLVLAIASCAHSQLYEVREHGHLVTEHNSTQSKERKSPLVRRARQSEVHVVKDEDDVADPSSPARVANPSSPAPSPSFLQEERRGRKGSSEGDGDDGTDPLGVMEIFHESEHGVVYGACKNFVELSGPNLAVAKCPHPLTIVGCSCLDPVDQNIGNCGTHFDLNEQSCTAYTKPGYDIHAIARCCYMDWASDFEVKVGAAAGVTGIGGVDDTTGAGKSTVECPSDKKVLGCACQPQEAEGQIRQAGCLTTKIEGARSCSAENVFQHEGGVKAEALCAKVPGSSHWEVVSAQVEYEMSNLSCSGAHLQMLSCSCGSEFESCKGGKVAGGRCDCDAVGGNCYATARCAEIPLPASDCVFADWGEWSDCSASCGSGKQDRIRVEAVLATNGGAGCSGAKKESKGCHGDASDRECTKEEEKGHWISVGGGMPFWVWLAIGGAVVVLGGGGAMYCYCYGDGKSGTMSCCGMMSCCGGSEKDEEGDFAWKGKGKGKGKW